MKYKTKEKEISIKRHRALIIMITLSIISVIYIFILTLIHFTRKKTIPQAPPEIEILDPANTNDEFAIKYKQNFEAQHKEDKDNKDKIFSEAEISSFNKTIKTIYEKSITGEIQYLKAEHDVKAYKNSLSKIRDSWKDKRKQTFDKFSGLWETIGRTSVFALEDIGVYPHAGIMDPPILLEIHTFFLIRKSYLTTKLTFSLVGKFVKTMEGLKNKIFYKYANIVSQIIESEPGFLIEDRNITIQEFNEWQSNRSNRIQLLFYSKNIALTTGLPMFIIYLFVREDEVKKLYKEGIISFSEIPEKDKIMEEVMESKKLEGENDYENIVIGKCYQLFSLLLKRGKDVDNVEIDKIILELISNLNYYLKDIITEMKPKISN